ncbi:MAG TPA: hypothetical protein VN894_20795 [Polyangiaceae bacterium]|nr:hypothetical protein [Polyangiaceae bacterium]
MSDDEESPFVDSKTRPSEALNAGRGLPPRAVSTELACARALLDALEALLRSGDAEPTRCDVVVQLADQLARVATTMKEWGVVPLRHVRAPR